MHNYYFSVRQTHKFFEKDYSYANAVFSPILIDNKVGPYGGNGISLNSNLATVKCFSEAIERRALMFPTVNVNKKYLAYDIVTGTKKYILGQKVGYNLKGDSTGTATHIDPYNAIEHAIGELIEKNALLRMWYKLDIKDVSHIGWMPSMNEIIKVNFLINDFFFPYYVVLAVSRDKNDFLHCGLGFSLESIDKAKKAAFEEMKLIWFQNDIEKMNPGSSLTYSEDESVYWNWTKDQQKHVKKLIDIGRLKKYCVSGRVRPKNIVSLGKMLGSSISNIYVIFISDPLFKGPFSTVRCFSNELVSCVPNKNMLLRLLSNTSINFINREDIESSVDCPIV